MPPALPAPPEADLQPHSAGRLYRSTRTVRLSDVRPDGRARLDAVARYLQDVATDDVRDAGVENAVAWVVRRTTIVASRRPRYGEKLRLATWCSGTGSALAERRTTIDGERGACVEAVSLWVSLDPRSLRPQSLDGSHFDLYRESAGSHRVKARFTIAAPPDGSGPGRKWPLRFSDFDLYGHVNNVVAWTAVEEEASRLVPHTEVGWGQVEYRRPVDPGETPSLVGRAEGDRVAVWLLGPDGSASVGAHLYLRSAP